MENCCPENKNDNGCGEMTNEALNCGCVADHAGIVRSRKLIAPTRDTHENWHANNPVVPEGVLCFVFDRLFEGSAEYFIGDGESTYDELPKYAGAPLSRSGAENASPLAKDGGTVLDLSWLPVSKTGEADKIPVAKDGGTLDPSWLPEASSDAVGGVMTSVKGADGKVPIAEGKTTLDPSWLPPATKDHLGGVKIGDRLTVTEDGTLALDPTGLFNGLTPEQLKEVLSQLLKEGGGLAADPEDGSLYVDFSLMPTEKFEELLKQIHVPIWITAQTQNWYVDAAKGADDLTTPKRGLSKDVPFKTVKACINNLVNNYNMTNFTVNVNVAPGTYNEGGMTLANYSVTTGLINIQTYPGQEDQAEITCEGLITLYSITGGRWRFANIKLKNTVKGDSGQQTHSNVLWINPTASVYLNNVTLTLDFQKPASDNVTHFAIANVMGITGAHVEVQTGCHFVMHQQTPSNGMFMIRDGGHLSFQGGLNGPETEKYTSTFDGDTSVIFDVTNRATVSTWTYPSTNGLGKPVFGGTINTLTCKKYSFRQGSGAAGALTKDMLDTLPGKVAGTFDATSWHV